MTTRQRNRWHVRGPWYAWVGATVVVLTGCHYTGRPDEGQLPGPRSLVLAWTSAESDYTYCVRWADYDGDGDPDLLAGNKGANRVYRNVPRRAPQGASHTRLEDTP